MNPLLAAVVALGGQMFSTEYIRDQGIRHVLRAEGGYVNNPKDPGGETNYGISKRAHPDVDIRNLTPDQAVDIYVREYWQPLGLNQIPAPLAVLVFDMGVNAGPDRAVRLLQERVGGITVDGILGPMTAGAVTGWYQRHDYDALRWYTEARLDFYESLSTYRTFGKGWRKRSLQLLMVACVWTVAQKINRSAEI